MFRIFFFQMQSKYTIPVICFFMTFIFAIQSVYAQDKPILMQNIKVNPKYLALYNTASPQLKQRIAALQAQGIAEKWTFQVGVTSVSNRKISEITGAIPPSSTAAPTEAPSGQASASPPIAAVGNVSSTAFDLRAFNLVTPIRNQGGCGSCWAFCAVASLESAHILRNKMDPNTLDLSEQQILNCSGAGSCGGGQPSKVWDYVKSKSCVNESNYAYQGTDKSCPVLTPTNFKIDSWGWVGANPEATTVQEIKNALVKYATVSSYVWVNDAFQGYRGGVINNNSRVGDGGWHCVQIIGWDDNLHAWLIKNSWGKYIDPKNPGWGLDGFGWIDYNVLDIGKWSTWAVANSTAPPPVPTQATKSITSVSRIKNSMENWWIDRNGTVQAAFWYEGGFWNRYQLGPVGGASVNGGIAAVSRAPTTMELWWIGSNGSVQGAFWYEGSTWKTYELAPEGSAAISSSITVVSRAKGTMEVWWVGANGSIQGAYWYEGGTWKRYEIAPANSASQTGGITAVSRAPGTMELWWIGTNGSVQGAYWYENNPWKRYEIAPANMASLSGGITAVSRATGTMELWYIGSNGSVRGAFWYEGSPWKLYEIAPAGNASLNSGIDAVSRIKTSMEVWWVGSNGSIQGKYWYEGGNWNGYQLAPAGSALGASGLSVVSRASGTMEFWWVGSNNSLQGNYWYDNSTWKQYELAPKR